MHVQWLPYVWSFLEYRMSGVGPDGWWLAGDRTFVGLQTSVNFFPRKMDSGTGCLVLRELLDVRSMQT